MNAPLRILCIEDSEGDRILVRNSLGREPGAFECLQVESREQFEAALACDGFDAVLADSGLVDLPCLQALETIKAKRPDLPVIVLTGCESTESAVMAMKHGAADYVTKSLWQIERLPQTIRAAIQSARLKAANRTELEESFRRLTRARRVLAECTRALIHAEDEQALLGAMCRIIVDSGHYHSAWIGFLDRDAPGVLSPVAQAGFPADQLPTSRAATASGDFVPTPVCAALSAGRHFVLRDDGREQLAAGGIEVPRAGRAVISLPLRDAGHTFGAVTLFADDPGAFDTDEVALLEEFVADVAYGIVSLRTRQAHQESLQALQRSESRFQQLAASIREVFFIADPASRTLRYASPAFAEVWGQGTAQQDWLTAVHAEDRQQLEQNLGRGGQFEQEFRVMRPDGSQRWVRARGFPMPAEGDGRPRVAGVAEDITERHEQEGRIARLRRIEAMLGGINSVIVRTSARQPLFEEACRIVVEQGKFATAWIGLLDGGAQLIHPMANFRAQGGAGVDLGLPLDVAEADNTVGAALRSGRAYFSNDLTEISAQDPLRAEASTQGFYSVVVLPLSLDQAAVGVMVIYAEEHNCFDDEELRLLDSLAADISFALQYLEREERLNYLAFYDALTGLPNAVLFQDRVHQLVQSAKRDLQQVVVILVDVERFKQLNDTWGRQVGDTLLKMVADRLVDSVQESTSIARIGVHTFALACLQAKDHAIDLLDERVFGPLGRPFVIEGKRLRITVRAGIAVYPNDEHEGEALVRNAEHALGQAIASDESFLFYAPEMNVRLAERLALEERLRNALDFEQFVLYYQPRVDLLSGRIIGAEALIRWQHPERGLVSPAEFIPLAEETGLILPMGEWVIDAVCAQLAEWLAAGIDVVPIALNLSAIQLKKAQVVRSVKRALVNHAVNANCLELELTESAVMANPDEATRILRALRELGIRLALDDFGTGYSSLAYLKRFPFNAVKIDRSFIVNITHNPEDAAIANAVLAMAHRLNLRVVAEGVENQAQLAYLQRIGCDEIQGYLFSQPVPADDFAALLRADKRIEPALATPDDERTLLLVDDEPNMLSALKRALRPDGYRILTASDGREALDLLARHKVKVIVSDQRMPNMSGSEFLSVVKQLYPDTIRIVLSGYTDLAVVTDAVNRGAVYKFLTKPWDDELLREHIRDGFRRYRPLMQ